jgi:hypothetical protein
LPSSREVTDVQSSAIPWPRGISLEILLKRAILCPEGGVERTLPQSSRRCLVDVEKRLPILILNPGADVL